MPDTNHEENLNKALNSSIGSIKQNRKTMLVGLASLENEVREIKSIYVKILKIDGGLMKGRVWFWRELGDLLREHQKHVKKAGYKWQEWADEHFRFIKATRREQCMLISRYGDSLEKFYFLGFDRLCDFANTMVRSKGDPELNEIAIRYGIKEGIEMQRFDENNYRFSFDKMKEYFKFKLKMNGFNYDKKTILDAIDTGVIFSKSDYDALKSNQTDQSDYLLAMILNCGSPKNQSGFDRKESTLILLAKLSENIDYYRYNKIIPQYLSKKIVKHVLLKLAYLYKKLP